MYWRYARRSQPVLVGREAELATVRRLVDAVQRGNGATLLVTGEPGIGKSRLVAEVAGRAAIPPGSTFSIQRSGSTLPKSGRPLGITGPITLPLRLPGTALGEPGAADLWRGAR